MTPPPDAPAVSLLRQVPLFSGLDDAQLQDLARRSRRRRYPGGEALFHEGDPGHALYVVISGRVDIRAVAASGEPVHVASRGRGEHFGELALFDDRPRMADAVTAGPCEVLMLPRDEFLRCIERSPAMALRVMASLADRLREAAHGLEARQERDVTGRVAAALLELAGAGEAGAGAGGARLAVKVTQRQLAERVGATRESVNRALAGLRAARAVRSEGRTLIVTDPEKLRRRAEA